MPLCGVYSTSIHLYMVMSCHQGIPLKYETILHYLQCVLLITQIKVPPARGKKLRRNAAAYGDASVRCKQFFCSRRSAVIVHKFLFVVGLFGEPFIVHKGTFPCLCFVNVILFGELEFGSCLFGASHQLLACLAIACLALRASACSALRASACSALRAYVKGRFAPK